VTARLVFDDGMVKLYQGNCMTDADVLGQCDLILTDPPYGETSLAWDRRVDDWPDHLRPLLAAAGSVWVWGSLRSHMATRGEWQGWTLAQDVVWEKHNGSSFHADRFRRVHEIAAHWYPREWAEVYRDVQTTNDATERTVKRKERPAHMGEIAGSTYTSQDGGPRMMRSVLFAVSCHGYAIAPTQKPVAVLDPLVRYSCPPGGLVCDPFAGSGSTLLAARVAGRRAVGMEIDPETCEKAAARLAQAELPMGAS
jgi:site-specific DNA-methyltransferase (adenine-specific)